LAIYTPVTRCATPQAQDPRKVLLLASAKSK